MVKAKQYFLKLKDVEKNKISEKMAVKGANSGLFEIKEAQYKKFLLGGHKFALFYDARNFVSKNHVVKINYKRRKIMDRYTDKRFLMPCGLRSVAHGSEFSEIMLEVERILFSLIDVVIQSM